VNPYFIFPCSDVSALTELLQRGSPIQLNWPGADGTHVEGCGLGPTGRISEELWKLWSELFHETEQRELLLGFTTGLLFFRLHTFFSDAKIKSSMAKKNSTDISIVSYPKELPHLLRVYT
jgi:hypothetical protein